jgi:hypothetical protein
MKGFDISSVLLFLACFFIVGGTILLPKFQFLEDLSEEERE